MGGLASRESVSFAAYERPTSDCGVREAREQAPTSSVSEMGLGYRKPGIKESGE